MAKKLFWVIMAWFFVIFAYIIMGSAMPAFTSITTEASTTMTATSNMTNYPGTLAAVDASPVYIWFIPGGIGVIATVVFLKKSNATG